MAGRRRILVIFGTRPEAIKLFPVIAALRADARFSVRTCVSGQHRELLDQVLALTGLRPDRDLKLMRDGQPLGRLSGAMLAALAEVIGAERPDRVLVQGDTVTALCGALGAYQHRVPIGHVEAGLRSGDLLAPWPEEGNRRMISAIADRHFAPTPRAAAALAAENVPADRIHLTGNTVIDALHWVRARLATMPPPGDALAEPLRRFAGRRIVAATCHRRESLGPGLARIAEALARIAARDDVGVVLPVHPNPDVVPVFARRLAGLDNVAVIDPLDYPAFIRLLSVSALVLTDSGGVQEEAPALGRPVLVLRDTTERPEAMDEGGALLVGTDPDRIVGETFRLLDDPVAYAAAARARQPFGDGRAAERIARVLAAEL